MRYGGEFGQDAGVKPYGEMVVQRPSPHGFLDGYEFILEIGQRMRLPKGRFFFTRRERWPPAASLCHLRLPSSLPAVHASLSLVGVASSNRIVFARPNVIQENREKSP